MMGWRRAIRRLPLAGAAVAGAAVGHSIAYLIVAPQGRARATLLAGTGHGYWSTAVAAEIVLGLLVVVTFGLRHFNRGRRSPKRPPSEEPWAWPRCWCGWAAPPRRSVAPWAGSGRSGPSVSPLPGPAWSCGRPRSLAAPMGSARRLASAPPEPFSRTARRPCLGTAAWGGFACPAWRMMRRGPVR